MLTNRSALRSSTLILSSTLLAMAAEPLPLPATLTGVVADSLGTKANVSYGDVDGDGYTDLGIGGYIYWGSANGWVSSSRILLTDDPLWIVPNLTGAGSDGKIRADVITVDGNSAGHLFKFEGRATLPVEKFTLPSIKGRPAVGNFRGSNLADLAWIDGSGYLQVATNNGGSFTLDPNPISAGSADYAAVAAIDWTGAQTGRLDLLLVSNNAYSTVQLFPYGATTPSLTQNIGSAYTNYRPEITVGKIHSGTNQRQDAIVTSDYSSVAIFSSGSTSATPNVSPFWGSIRGWIVPDVTGDGIDEVAFYGMNGQEALSGGLLHGGASIGNDLSQSTPSADRPIPGVLAPDFAFGFTSYNSKSRQPIAVPYNTIGSTWERHLVLVDALNYSGSVTQVMPILAPIISGPLVAQTGTGPQAMVDPSVAVQFQSPGSITAIKVTVSGAVLGDAISDAVATTATSTDVLLNGDLIRVYSGNLTPTETQALLTNLRFTGVAGYGQRSVSISIGGTAVSGDTATRASAYLSNTLNVSTINIPLPPSLTFTAIANGTVGTPVSCEVRGGSAPYTVVVDGGTGVVNTANGISTIVVTPTRTGLITATVTSSNGISGVFTFTANAAPVPALVFTKANAASVGGTIIVEVNGGDGNYTVTVAGGTGFAGGSPIDANGANAKNLFITPTQSGVITVTVTDSTGLTGNFTFIAANLPTATEPAPAVLESVGEATVFGAICPGTFGGVASLRAAFGSVDDRRARGFTWNSETQKYRELPTEPNGGLLPTDGVFLATRVALGLDFSGPAMPPGSTIVLRAGWNFVGLGPVQLSSGSVVRSHSLADDFTLSDLSGRTVTLSSISQAYQWTGTAYVTTPTLQSGVGYWIDNVATPTGTVLLTRKDSDMDGRAVNGGTATSGAANSRTGAFAGNVGTPPVPPNGDQQAQPESQGSCGSGSGIAVLLAGLMAFLKLGFRRK